MTLYIGRCTQYVTTYTLLSLLEIVNVQNNVTDFIAALQRYVNRSVLSSEV